MVYQRSGRDGWYVAVPTVHGSRVKRLASLHKGTAVAMERMLEELGPKGKRAWDLLTRVVDGSLSLGMLYDAWGHNDLEGLRERLRDVDLTPHVARWQAWLRDRVKADTAAHYAAHVRTLIPDGAPFLRSSFTAPAIAQWLASRTKLAQHRGARSAAPTMAPASGSTKRKYLAAVQSFAGYLVQMGVLATNPTREVQAPRASAPRVVEVALADVIRLVEFARPPFRAIFALCYGGGVEISAALSLTELDVDLEHREVRARGTKAHRGAKEHTRDRVVRVAEWAWPYLEAHHATLTPGERLFRDVDRWQASDAHREALRALGMPHRRLHDSRHVFAIRLVRAGTPYELVARALGHADVTMVARVYARFAPRSDERDRWERIAAERDRIEANPRGLGATTGASGAAVRSNEVANPLKGSDFASSRGGTRTHDPGIMSSDSPPGESAKPSDPEA